VTHERIGLARSGERRPSRLCAGIDTCSDRLGLALVEAHLDPAGGGKAAQPAVRVLDEREVDARNAHCEALFPLIAELLEHVGRDVSEIALVGVTAGPGRFTSLRIGLATAQGLALGLGARVVPVSAFEAAAAALGAAHANARVAIVLDAGPEVHWALCRAGDPASAPLAGPTLAPPAAAARDLAALAAASPEPLAIAGSGAARIAALLGAAAGVTPAPAAIALPNLARAAAVLAIERAGSGIDPADLEPLYLRPTRAEEIRNNAPAGSAQN